MRWQQTSGLGVGMRVSTQHAKRGISTGDRRRTWASRRADARGLFLILNLNLTLTLGAPGQARQKSRCTCRSLLHVCSMRPHVGGWVGASKEKRGKHANEYKFNRGSVRNGQGGWSATHASRGTYQFCMAMESFDAICVSYPSRASRQRKLRCRRQK